MVMTRDWIKQLTYVNGQKFLLKLLTHINGQNVEKTVNMEMTRESLKPMI